MEVDIYPIKWISIRVNDFQVFDYQEKGWGLIK